VPELPEVETILRGIQPHITDQRVTNIIVRQPRLRWLIPADFQQKLTGKNIHTISRRAKYLLFHAENGTAILHLGMSGSLRILTNAQTPQKHDHVDIELANNKILRYTDPRRFGALLWTEENYQLHPLISALGPEPLANEFTANYLWQRSRSRSVPIKSFIMDNKIVVGVGNIYAAESLFRSGIHPLLPAKRLSKIQAQELVKAIKTILRQAIQRGGTTLKDFVNSDGKPGYFSNKLQVYGRAGLSCVHCKTFLKSIRIAQRSTVFCKKCQTI